MRLVIEKREGFYCVQHNENEFDCQSLTNAFANIIEPEYLNEITDLVEVYFKNWGVTQFALGGDGENRWCAVVEVNSEYVAVEENHPIAAIMALMTPVMLSKVAQQLKCFLPE